MLSRLFFEKFSVQSLVSTYDSLKSKGFRPATFRKAARDPVGEPLALGGTGTRRQQAAEGGWGAEEARPGAGASGARRTRPRGLPCRCRGSGTVDVNEQLGGRLPREASAGPSGVADVLLNQLGSAQ